MANSRKSRREETEQTAAAQTSRRSSTPPRTRLRVSSRSNGDNSSRNDSRSRATTLKTRSRATRSRAERANALAELASRRMDIAARRKSKNRCSPDKTNIEDSSASALILAVRDKQNTLFESSIAARKKPNNRYSPPKTNVEESSASALILAIRDKENTLSESNLPTFDDIKKITIGRSTLEKWHKKPFFDELIAGCFVRLAIGKSYFAMPVHRLCMVRNADDTKSDYNYRFDDGDTCKYLNLVWGNEKSAARWRMTEVSVCPPLKEEFDQLVKEVRCFGGYMPTRSEVLEKIEAVEKIDSLFIHSVVTVRQMLAEGRAIGWSRTSIEAEKARVRAEMAMARARDDAAEVDRLKARLRELEEEPAGSRDVVKNDKAIKMAEMNRKNKIENFKNASGRTSLENGNSGSNDPFSRRWTKPRNYYAICSRGEAITSALVETSLVEPESNAVGSGKLMDTSAPIDQGNESNKLHDFELSISLAALEKFGGPKGARAGYMANKGRIEATHGCKWVRDDGDPTKEHPRVISVDEYRRRRGLI